MRFLNQVDGAHRLITDPQHRLVTDEEKERWDSSSGGMVTKESIYTLTTTTSTVPINISEYNPSRHTLFVIKNTTTLANNADYTISADGLYINNISGSWVGTVDVPIRFHFIAQMTAKFQPDLVATVVLNNLYTAAQDEITNVPIGITEYNYLSDYLFVYQGEIRLIEGIHYNLAADGVSIDLLEYSLKTEDTVYFEVLKHMQKDIAYADGTLIDPGSVPETALSASVRNKLNTVTEHNHDSSYADIVHNHDSDYADIVHNHDSDYADIVHNHDSDYADIVHNHDDVYYTETEVDNALSGKANLSHTHNVLKSKVAYAITESSLPSQIVNNDMQIDFINNFSGGGSQYRTIITIASVNAYAGAMQIALPYNSGTNEPLYYRLNNYQDDAWGAWIKIPTTQTLAGTATPASSLGNNGDVYIKYV